VRNLNPPYDIEEEFFIMLETKVDSVGRSFVGLIKYLKSK